MKTNVEKVLERDQKLSELDDRAGKGIYMVIYIGDQNLKNINSLFKVEFNTWALKLL